MKNSNHSFKTILSIPVMFLLITSCSTSKKTALSCPELPGVHKIKKIVSYHNRHDKKLFAFSQRHINERAPGINKSRSLRKDQKTKILTLKESKKQSDIFVLPDLREVNGISKIEFNNNLVASLDNSIITVEKTNSSILIDRKEVTATGQNELNAMGKEKTGGTLIPVSKSDKISDNYTVAENKQYASVYTNPLPQSNYVKTEGLGIAGFIASLVGLVVAGIPLGIIAVVFGAVSLGKIKRYPERFKGRGLAIASFVIGIVDIIGAIVVLAVM